MSKTCNKTLYKPKELLGIDRIKIDLPGHLASRKLDLFDMANPQKSNFKNMYIETFWFSKHANLNFRLYLVNCYNNEDKDFLMSNSLRVDVNIPKFIYGNNVFESTYEDLYNTCMQVVAYLNGYGIHCNKNYMLNSPISYLEIGRNFSEWVDIDNIYLNTRSYNRNKISSTKYKFDSGKGVILKNSKKMLSIYDKNLEIKTFTPHDPILSFLNRRNLNIIRLEQKYTSKTEIFRNTQKYLNKPIHRFFPSQYITVDDILNSDVTKLLIYDIWEKYKLHTNIYDLSKANVKNIFSYINNSDLGDKMKKYLLTLINGFKNNIPFGTTYENIKKELSVNYPKKVLNKYEEIMEYFHVPSFSFINIINNNIYRNKTIQEQIIGK